MPRVLANYLDRMRTESPKEVRTARPHGEGIIPGIAGSGKGGSYSHVRSVNEAGGVAAQILVQMPYFSRNRA
jgi:hypothetical protein